MDDTCGGGSQRYTQTTDLQQHCSPLVRATVVFPDLLWRLICPTAMQVCAGGCTPDWFGPLMCDMPLVCVVCHLGKVPVFLVWLFVG